MTDQDEEKRKKAEEKRLKVEENKKIRNERFLACKAENFGKGNKFGKGRKKGVKNRSTILKEMMELALLDSKGNGVPNPLDPTEKRMSVESAMHVAMVQKAIKGNVRAYEMLMDNRYGKQTSKDDDPAVGATDFVAAITQLFDKLPS